MSWPSTSRAAFFGCFGIVSAGHRLATNESAVPFSSAASASSPVRRNVVRQQPPHLPGFENLHFERYTLVLFVWHSQTSLK
jgi:hypothetical protein